MIRARHRTPPHRYRRPVRQIPSRVATWRIATAFGSLLAVVVAVSAALALINADSVTAADPQPQTLAPVTSQAAPSTPGPEASTLDNPAPDAPPTISPTVDLAASFNELAQGADATIGLSVAPLGGASSALPIGDWTSGAAWSTMKVPLAMASLREPTVPRNAIDQAITNSDNSAGEQLWTTLGDPQAAAVKVEAVLRDAGDPTTVESRKLRTGFSAFGQSQWSLTDQANFLARAACDTTNAPVINLMGQIASDQSWGLGTLTGAQFKGGWGPAASGEYLVRQVGIVPTLNGRAVVAIAAASESGSFAQGTAVLDSMAQWIAAHLAELPSGECGD